MPYLCLVEGIKISTKFPKRHICNISCIKINTFFVIFDNKYWGISKSDQNILYLKERMLVNGKSFKYKCYEIGYAEPSEKSGTFQEIPVLKKVHILNNYLFRKKITSGSCAEKLFIFKKQLIKKVFASKKQLLERSSYSTKKQLLQVAALISIKLMLL